MKYIPQAAPFVMIDEVLSANETTTVTSFKIKEGHLLVEKDQFTEAGLIENMAQTAAAGMGKKAAESGEQPPVGFIGQVKDLNIDRLPPAGATIITEVKNKNQILNVIIAEGCVQWEGQEIARAAFKIFLQ